MDNKLTPEQPDLEGVTCPKVDDARMIREGYSQYTTDEMDRDHSSRDDS